MLRFLTRASLLAIASTFLVALSVTDAVAQTCTGSIGDYVWFDENQNGIRDPEDASKGINGVTLELRNSGGTLLATTTTGQGVGSISGQYQFGFLCAGTYTVTIASGVPAGYVPTVSPAGADPARDSSTSPATVTLAFGQKDPTVDFGFITACAGRIGDRVWNDVNGNGVQDAGEAGMAGVLVRLFLEGVQVAVATTDASGNYSFPGLCPGDYTVVVDTPSGFNASPTSGTPDTTLDSNASGGVVTLALNENNPTIDFGFVAQCLGVIGDRVWFDTDQNGVQDAGELGIAGVSVELLNSGGTVIATTVTNGTGNYQFTGLCAGSYTVRVVSATLPAGVVPTATGAGTPGTDSNGSPAAVTLPTNTSSDLTIDFGYTKAPCIGRIGDFVWNDANSNGVQDAGELGIPNVRVMLRDSVTNAVLAVDVTDGSGRYMFEGLCAGDFIVEVDPTTLPGGMVASPSNQGSNDAVDSDGVNHSVAVSLPADSSTDLTIDFGYYRKTLIQIVKLTNGTDNNTPTGPVVEVGTTVTWTYRVTSTGSVEPLFNVVVVDDNGTPGNTADDFSPAFTGGDTNGNGLLEVGETWTYTASAVATAGQYANWSTANGRGYLSNEPAPPSQDPDHYYGETPVVGTGRFTGGGMHIKAGGTRVTLGLTIHCDLLLSNNLEVNWARNRFHMTEHVTTVACTDDPAIIQRPPVAPLDTLIGIGTGRYNNQYGYTIEFTLVDYGEPGRDDRVALKIYETANPSNVVLNVPLQELLGGNLQAHYDQPHKQ